MPESGWNRKQNNRQLKVISMTWHEDKEYHARGETGDPTAPLIKLQPEPSLRFIAYAITHHTREPFFPRAVCCLPHRPHHRDTEGPDRPSSRGYLPALQRVPGRSRGETPRYCMPRYPIHETDRARLLMARQSSRTHRQSLAPYKQVRQVHTICLCPRKDSHRISGSNRSVPALSFSLLKVTLHGMEPNLGRDSLLEIHLNESAMLLPSCSLPLSEEAELSRIDPPRHHPKESSERHRTAFACAIFVPSRTNLTADEQINTTVYRLPDVGIPSKKARIPLNHRLSPPCSPLRTPILPGGPRRWHVFMVQKRMKPIPQRSSITFSQIYGVVRSSTPYKPSLDPCQLPYSLLVNVCSIGPLIKHTPNIGAQTFFAAFKEQAIK